MCPIFQISNVTGENLDLLKMFLNLLSPRTSYREEEPAEFQIDDTYSVPVRGLVFGSIFCSLFQAEKLSSLERRVLELFCWPSRVTTITVFSFLTIGCRNSCLWDNTERPNQAK